MAKAGMASTLNNWFTNNLINYTIIDLMANDFCL
ncbi:hypothetical protein QE441_001691 [Chryseobacterium sp. SORGH_AS909]|nr:hypothetical protein [Chryseobacterium sp. SORGH_AS_0909]